jgi:hypothetical protein
MPSNLPNEEQVDNQRDEGYGFVVSGIYTQVHRNKLLCDSGLLKSFPDLANAIQLAAIHRIYVLYKRETSSYYFVDPASGDARVLKVIQKADKLSIDSLVAIVESLLGEETKYGREESCRIKYG